MLYDFLKGLYHKNYEPLRHKEKEGAPSFTISRINYFLTLDLKQIPLIYKKVKNEKNCDNTISA